MHTSEFTMYTMSSWHSMGQTTKKISCRYFVVMMTTRLCDAISGVTDGPGADFWKQDEYICVYFHFIKRVS